MRQQLLQLAFHSEQPARIKPSWLGTSAERCNIP